MPNVQQPEMRRSGETSLVQDSDGPLPPKGGKPSHENRKVPPDQQSPYGPQGGKQATAQDAPGREVEGD